MDRTAMDGTATGTDGMGWDAEPPRAPPPPPAGVVDRAADGTWRLWPADPADWRIAYKVAQPWWATLGEDALGAALLGMAKALTTYNPAKGPWYPYALRCCQNEVWLAARASRHGQQHTVAWSVYAEGVGGRAQESFTDPAEQVAQLRWDRIRRHLREPGRRVLAAWSQDPGGSAADHAAMTGLTVKEVRAWRMRIRRLIARYGLE